MNTLLKNDFRILKIPRKNTNPPYCKRKPGRRTKKKIKNKADRIN